MKKISIILIVLSILFLNTNIIKAQDKNLDLVLVLDKSGSMNTGDPNALCKEATKMLVEMMPTNTSSVGIIAFNRQQQVVSNLTSLNNENTIKSITNKVDDITYKGGTNLGDALYKATTLFEDNDNTKGILVLSDGEDDFSSYEQDKEVASLEACSDALSWASKNDCKIYTLGFNYKGSMNKGSEGYERLSEIASSTDGKMTTKTNAKDIHEFFIDMLGDLIGTNPQDITNNKINIKPYVKEANIYINSLDSTKITDNSITLIDNNGDTVDLNDDNISYYKSTYSAVIKLYEPASGTWIVKTNFSSKIGYLAQYGFTLKTTLVDSNNNTVSEVHNGSSAIINTSIVQDDKTISDSSIFNDDGFKAIATITPRNTKESKTISLTNSNGILVGNINFNEESIYDIKIKVTSSSLNLEDTVTIESTNSPIELVKELDKQSVIKGKTLTITNKEIDSLVSDKEGDSYTYNVVSSDTTYASVKKTDEGIQITGNKWGSSRITITYKDKQGNEVETTFVVKVKDIVLMVFFASIPVLIGLLVLLVLYLIARKSRIIKGYISINEVTIKHGNKTYYINDSMQYQTSVFFGKRKTLGNGMKKYSNDIYSNNENKENELLFDIINKKDSIIKKYLDEVLFIGTYLGLKGCMLKINKNNHISMNNNDSYGRVIKKKFRNSGDFTIYVSDNEYIVIIDGSYYRTRSHSKDVFTSDSNDTFDDDFFD